MGILNSLSREQKEATGLLQIGTFLEYFDVMLYVHMAVILNELFFPKTDPHTASLLAAFAFCSTFVFRPIGALIFGWIGDNIGRRSTIILTTSLMSVSCILMACLPTYAQIGIAATWIMTLCRIAQGMSSMGEIVGAQIYLTESIRRPISYPMVAYISVASDMGGMVALGISYLVTSFLFNWRLAFWIGAIIAFVGAVARTRLRETPDFLKLKRDLMKDAADKLRNVDFPISSNKSRQENKFNWKEKAFSQTTLSYFLIYCGRPLTFYLAYLYFNPLLKEQFAYTPEDIIKHNFLLSVILLFSAIVWAQLSAYIHPLRIIKVRGMLTLCLMLSLPFLVGLVTDPMQLFFIQTLILILQLSGMPAGAVFIYHLPIYSRFTYASFLYALARAMMYIITSFGLVYLSEYFGFYGLWLITIPVSAAFLYGASHFENLERKGGHYA